MISSFKLITDPVLLRKPSEEITNKDDGLGLARTMWKWLKNYNRGSGTLGIGLSACQVGLFKQIFIVNLPYSKFYMANPKIISHSEQQVTSTEGCLSLPGVKCKVPRYLWVEVSSLNFPENRFYGLHPLAKDYKDMNKNLMEVIVLQHEYDHIFGKLIVDYNVDSTRSTVDTN